MDRLKDEDVGVLQEALDDEYHAWATYDQVIADFGEVAPFINIRDAEARHIEALVSLFRQFGVAVPDNPWPGRVERYTDLRAACGAGVAAEKTNAQMYDRLLNTTQRPEILAVLRNLRDASQQRHLPAFERCVERTATGCNTDTHDSAARGRRWRGGRPDAQG